MPDNSSVQAFFDEAWEEKQDLLAEGQDMAAKRTIRKMEEKVGDLIWPFADKAHHTFRSAPVPCAKSSMLPWFWQAHSIIGEEGFCATKGDSLWNNDQ